jgi:hypothetical protein
MPDPYMPDMIVEVLRAENARLIREVHDLTLKIAECNDHKAQFAQALALATSEIVAMKRSLDRP